MSSGPPCSAAAALETHLQKRPPRRHLISHNVLKDFGVLDPSLHDAVQALLRTRRRSRLRAFLHTRPSTAQLVADHILERDPTEEDDADEEDAANASADANASGVAKSPRHTQLQHFLRNRPSLSDVAKLNLFEDTMTWTRVLQGGALPMPRNCACLSVGPHDSVYLSGGYGYGFTGGGAAYSSTELLVFDCQREVWSRPPTAGCLPEARFSHTMVLDPASNCLITFGGCRSGHGVWLNDVYVLREEPHEEQAPSPPHSAQQHRQPHLLMYYRPEVSGEAPCGRAAHTATMVDGRMFVFGGNDGHSLFRDLYALDTHSWCWSRLETSGEIPSARAGHAAVAIDSVRLAVFGGGSSSGPTNDLFLLDTETLHWSRVRTLGTPPAPRVGHSMHLLMQTTLLVFGGGTASKAYDDLHCLDLDTLMWSRPSDAGSVPAPRTGHGSCMIYDHVYVFGGADVDGNVFNDLHVLDCTFVNLSRIISAAADDTEKHAGTSGDGGNLTRTASVPSAEGLMADSAVAKARCPSPGTATSVETRLQEHIASLRRQTHAHYMSIQQQQRALADTTEQAFRQLNREIDSLADAFTAQVALATALPADAALSGDKEEDAETETKEHSVGEARSQSSSNAMQ